MESNPDGVQPVHLGGDSILILDSLINCFDRQLSNLLISFQNFGFQSLLDLIIFHAEQSLCMCMDINQEFPANLHVAHYDMQWIKKFPWEVQLLATKQKLQHNFDQYKQTHEITKGGNRQTANIYPANLLLQNKMPLSM